jgi:hypothetical protein
LFEFSNLFLLQVLDNKGYNAWCVYFQGQFLHYHWHNKNSNTKKIFYVVSNFFFCVCNFLRFIFDVPPNSLIDSNVNQKVKTTKEEEIGARSLTRSILGVKGHARAPRWGLGWVTSGSIIHMGMHKPNNKLVNA